MSSWRDQILKEFTPKVARLTLVADPDGLLLEEGILEAIRERGFELIPFEDHVAFRYAYESKFRSRWDRGEQTDLPAPGRGKFFVYVLKCSDNSFYIGQTDDIPRRLRLHKAGEVSWTSKHLPVEIIHWEEFDSRKDAVEREKGLKTGFGRKWLKREFEHDRLAARQAGLVVVLHPPASNLGSLPYDLLQAGRRLSFSLGDIFPNLSYPVIADLNRGDLDALFDAQKKHAPGTIGDNATKEFVLRHVFEIVPELIQQPSDLLRALLRRHYRGQRIPAILDERFIQILRQTDMFDDWPLEIIIHDREAFFAFLQERWPVFLDSVATKTEPDLREAQKPYGFAISGPVDLPFDHHDIRIYIDSLFLEGLLQSVPHEHADVLSKTWLSIGVRTDPSQDWSRRLTKLVENLQASIPPQDARHAEWFHFARGWAELAVLAHDPDATLEEHAKQEIETLQSQVDDALTAWLVRRYAGLINLPPVPPVMLHHLLRFLARHLGENRNQKVALLLVDGLSLDQWIVVRDSLLPKRPNILIREHTIFGWIPTITSVSRQAALAGKPPIYFPNSIHTTNSEPILWAQFWMDQGLSQHEVAYAKGLGDGSLQQMEELLAHPKIRVIGLIIDKIDKIMHGMELGIAGMHNQVRQWAQQPYLADLLDLLLGRGFRVFLASDHGNIEAEGCGRPEEGIVADLRGERARVYSNRLLFKRMKESFPSALEWAPIGLPEDYFALIAPNRMAFVHKGDRIVSHGGISIEEVIVPFIEIERKRI